MDARMTVLLLLAACQSGVYDIGKPACDADFLDWDDDYARWVAEADNFGRFDVETGWALYPTVSGSWDIEHQTFSLDYLPAADSWRAETGVAGTLTLLAGGDYRFEGTYHETDVLGEEYEASVQTSRIDCTESSVQIYDGGVLDQVSTWSDGVREIDAIDAEDDGTVTVWDTTYRSDGTATFEGDVVAPEYEGTIREEAFWQEGPYEVTYHYVFDDQVVDSDVDGARDGSRHVHKKVTFDDRSWNLWEYDISYAGDGEGTLETSDGDECDVEFEDGARSCDCGRGWRDC
jgi:hypothetical protein